MDILFFLIGIIVGGLGTMVGAGGGFLLTPVLIYVLPHLETSRLTAISMVAIFTNSCSGTIGYTFQKQIHWKSVFAFTITSVPGALVGIYLGSKISRMHFESLFSFFLIIFGSLIFYRSFHLKEKRHGANEIFWQRKKILLGSMISFGVGVLSTLLGIGGGIIHVPLLSQWLGYPVHIAAGTSHAILAFSSGFAVLQHYFNGDLMDLPSFTPYLVVGLVIGAQLGARYSKKVSSHWIMRALGIAVISVAIRLLMKHWL